MDYTPTTEEVRSAWMDGLSSLGAEFDRWLAEVKAQAWEEGFVHGAGSPVTGSITHNPYRQGETE